MATLAATASEPVGIVFDREVGLIEVIVVMIALALLLFGTGVVQWIIATLRSLVRRVPAQTPFDEEAYARHCAERDKAHLRELRDFARDRALDQFRNARKIYGWANDALAKQQRGPIPLHLPRSYPIPDWIFGLTVPEIQSVASASIFDIAHAIFHGHQIPGVRAIGRLDRIDDSELRWPVRVPPPDEHTRYASGGGPKRASSFSSMRGRS